MKLGVGTNWNKSEFDLLKEEWSLKVKIGRMTIPRGSGDEPVSIRGNLTIIFSGSEI
jgi:hypothetical protein